MVSEGGEHRIIVVTDEIRGQICVHFITTEHLWELCKVQVHRHIRSSENQLLLVWEGTDCSLLLRFKSKLTLPEDTGGKLLVFSKAMVLHGCKWPGMHSETHPQWTAGNFRQEDEVQTPWAVISTSGSVEFRYLRVNTTKLTFLRSQIYSQQRKKTSHNCQIKMIKN